MSQSKYDDDDRSIRRIALKIFNENEDDAREELDQIIFGVEDSIKIRSIFYDWSPPILVIFPILFLTFYLLTQIYSKVLGDIFYVTAMLSACVPLFTFWNWYRFQYGRGKPRKPRSPIYGGASNEARDKLEKLFTYMQRESAPKSYYRDKRGTRYDLDPNYSYGSLRVLLLSNSPSVRGLYLTSSFRRVSAPIKIDADPNDVIKALGVGTSTQKGSARQKDARKSNASYDYKAMLLLIIEHPALKDINPGTHNSQTLIIDLIKRMNDSSGDEQDEDFHKRIPEKTQMYPFAREILAAIEKNRSLSG
jgi:hypothetical protein